MGIDHADGVRQFASMAEKRRYEARKPIKLSGRMKKPIRIHQIKIDIKYEGEEVEQNALDVLMRYLGDDLCTLLRARSKDADQIYTLGAIHNHDIEED